MFYTPSLVLTNLYTHLFILGRQNVVKDAGGVKHQ